VRVLSVAQVGDLLSGETGECGLLFGGEFRGEPGGDRRVVGRSVGEGAGGEAATGVEVEAVSGGGVEHGRVVGRIGHDGDCGVVLRRRTHHRGSADVDLLDAVVEAGSAGDGVGERVEVDDDEVERFDLELGQLLQVLGLRESARMPAWTRGWRVLTRPSRHSGNPVSSSTFVTAAPASAIFAAVDPVDTIWTPAAWRPRASSSSPVLS
jgi:hypothetical protein